MNRKPIQFRLHSNAKNESNSGRYLIFAHPTKQRPILNTIIVNIHCLYGITHSNRAKKGSEMKEVGQLRNAFIEFDTNGIVDFGSMQQIGERDLNTYSVLDAKGRLVIPSFVDCHTHAVFAASRALEFVDRINGLSYQEVAKKGGGILNSAEKLENMTEDELFVSAKSQLELIIAGGTGALEIKSGYGLNTEAELKMLRVIKRLQECYDLPIRSTFLGAHAYPKQFKEDKSKYIDLIINDMLPKIAAENLADYIDVFCEDGYFGLPETEAILKAGAKFGLKARIHVNQFNSIGGVELAQKCGAISVEHLEVMTEDDISHLKNGNMFPVGLPACSFFLEIPYTPVRRLIEEGLPVVLATDFNPGSSPCISMNFVMSLGCVKMKLLPTEAFNAVTINAANALELQDEVGSIAHGKRANLLITNPMQDLAELPYFFGSDNISTVILNGKVVRS
ncbi:MAG: imidazolonepropionase [Bacteroidia bacterium]